MEAGNACRRAVSGRCTVSPVVSNGATALTMPAAFSLNLSCRRRCQKLGRCSSASLSCFGVSQEAVKAYQNQASHAGGEPGDQEASACTCTLDGWPLRCAGLLLDSAEVLDQRQGMQPMRKAGLTVICSRHRFRRPLS